jgi:hypothetical protein
MADQVSLPPELADALKVVRQSVLGLRFGPDYGLERLHPRQPPFEKAELVALFQQLDAEMELLRGEIEEIAILAGCRLLD